MLTQAEKVEKLKDLYQVGKTKSIGYLPIDTITRLYETSLDEVIAFAEANNIRHVSYAYPSECNVFSGALFFYDEVMLQELLKTYRESLKEAGVPYDDGLAYISHIAMYSVSHREFPKAYWVVAKSFNDPRLQNNKHFLA